MLRLEVFLSPTIFFRVRVGVGVLPAGNCNNNAVRYVGRWFQLTILHNVAVTQVLGKPPCKDILMY